MKTLFVSLAFFLHSGDHLLVTKSTVSSMPETTQPTLEELMSFRKKTPQAIEKILIAKGWVNTTEEDVVNYNIDEGDYSWKLRKSKEEIFSEGSLYYAIPEKTIVYGTNNDHIFKYLFNQALVKQRNLTYCRKDHEEEYENYEDEGMEKITIYHFYNDDHNIIFRKGETEDTGLYTAEIIIEEKKK